MLCFVGCRHQSHEGDIVLVSDATKTNTQKSTITCSDSSSASSGNNKNNVTVTTTFNKKKNVSSQEQMQGTVITSSIPPAGQRRSKKIKSENPTSAFRAVRREKLGDRITALQQLVSPFGKTDTASVLHEAMGYIRFRQDQVQVLCSPHLLTPALNGGGEESGKDLRSRGLCLVPAVHVANSTGADYCSPATMGNGHVSLVSQAVKINISKGSKRQRQESENEGIRKPHGCMKKKTKTWEKEQSFLFLFCCFKDFPATLYYC
ncbi:hypothetical protein K2173_002257 [Erythroxylum novogranatense]|uniref:BHLH domain-containing protein n=1 Tax=Erythroxylum novogranatense TaxID=1862640 RepID=A0AAV8TAQ3_9ROSI|nr:hypothetical protein K2173_002257 [Erythroxylum novogranatense]